MNIVRITPIYMGNTALLKFKHVGLMGSPPYTWGILNSVVVHEVIDRITPIYMGNTKESLINRGNKRDHPHIHGEYRLIAFDSWRLSGSPPYTWGILANQGDGSRVPGITPIYMGNTSRRQSELHRPTDHPHIHGEYQATRRSTATHQGSPPYTWGIQTGLIGIAHNNGITPIYMGNTKIYQRHCFGSWDHPHIHGEYGTDANGVPKYKGSPPYTWGILRIML